MVGKNLSNVWKPCFGGICFRINKFIPTATSREDYSEIGAIRLTVYRFWFKN
jgi:hypothetical protein